MAPMTKLIKIECESLESDRAFDCQCPDCLLLNDVICPTSDLSLLDAEATEHAKLITQRLLMRRDIDNGNIDVSALGIKYPLAMDDVRDIVAENQEAKGRLKPQTYRAHRHLAVLHKGRLIGMAELREEFVFESTMLDTLRLALSGPTYTQTNRIKRKSYSLTQFRTHRSNYIIEFSSHKNSTRAISDVTNAVFTSLEAKRLQCRLTGRLTVDGMSLLLDTITAGHKTNAKVSRVTADAAPQILHSFDYWLICANSSRGVFKESITISHPSGTLSATTDDNALHRSPLVRNTLPFQETNSPTVSRRGSNRRK
jgi:hypothetical protein